MINAKDQYDNAKIIVLALESTLNNAKDDARMLLTLWQAECTHENKKYTNEFNYHNREDWEYCHCEDCGKYLGRK